MRESSEDLRPQPQRSRRCRMRPVKKGTGFFLLIFKRGESVMVFSSASFLIFFLPCLLVLYFLVPRRCRYLRNLILLAFSLAFYACGGPKFLLLMLLSIVINYVGGLLAGPAHRPRTRRLGMTLAVVLGLALLGWFKYAGFFGEMLHALLPVVPVPQVTLPIGISFFTFQGLSYVIDVYRGDAEAERSLLDYAAFQAMFPQLVMGPILRLRDVSAELHTKRPFSRAAVESGFSLFVVGLGCKVVLADQLASLWTALERIGFAYLSAPLAWFGAVGYSLQLYYDFAGYSLMAMGLARMLGFVIPRNFDLPYCSRSISEFWRRWHITLGIWFRDYLYIPLGGSRNGKRRLLLSLFVVWTLTGLWHGAAWNFVLWGLVLFVFIALEKFCIGSFLERHRFLSRLYFLFLIPQTWVVFRISDLGELGDYFSRLYPFLSSGESVFAGDLLRQLESYWWLFALGILLATPWPRRFYEKYRATPLVWLPLFAVFWLCLYLIATGTGNPFLYARF